MDNDDYFTRSQLRLKTIIRLRWIAIAGQLITVFGVYYGLQYEFPFNLALAVIGLSVLTNLVLRSHQQEIKVLGDQLGAWMLAYDIIQLAVLLYLTGGVHNPFASLLVAPIAVSAASLPGSTTIKLGLLACFAATLIAFFYMPVPFETPTGLELPLAYRIGNWLSVLCAMVFIGFFAWRVANESRQMSAALVATEAILAREQKLSAIDGLAAAAAHGLGTPLSTISLVARELENELDENNPLRDDIMLIHKQAVRCSEILQSLAARGSDAEFLVAKSKLSDLLEEVAHPLKGLGTEIIIVTKAENVGESSATEPLMPRNPGILYSLNNLVENAVEYASKRVEISATWSDADVRIKVSDDGPGFSSELLDSLGEPFVSKRANSPEFVNPDQQGLGLGFFISKTLLERSGASITYGNRSGPQSGAFVVLVWPRGEIDLLVKESEIGEG